MPVLGVALFGWPRLALVALAAAVASITPVALVMTKDDARELVPALPGTARIVALYGVLLGLSLALA